EHYDVRAARAERLQRLAVGLACRDGFGVGLERDRAGARSGARGPALRLGDRELAIRTRAKLGESLFFLLRIERLAVPALLVLEKRHAFPFDGASEDGCRALGTARTCERVVDLRDVMAIDNGRIDP